MSMLLSSAIDISIPVFPGMHLYPHECDVVREFHLSPTREKPVTCTHWTMTAHAGTHVDAPTHFHPEGRSISDFAASEFEFRCAVIDVKGSVTPDVAERALVDHPHADALLFRTQDGSQWEKPFDPHHPAITHPAGKVLARSGKLRLVGIDYYSVEPYGCDSAETHIALCRAGILIMEGIQLSYVPGGSYRLICLPALWRDSEAAPCRAILIPEVAL